MAAVSAGRVEGEAVEGEAVEGIGKAVECRPLVWRQEEDKAERDGVGLNEWDVIVGSDLIYSRASVLPLAATIQVRQRDTGRAWTDRMCRLFSYLCAFHVGPWAPVTC